MGETPSKKFKVATSASGCSKPECTVYIGAIRNNQGSIEYGVASATSKAKFKKMYKRKKPCERERSYSKYPDASKRDFTSAEKSVIEKNMKSMAFISAANKAYPLPKAEYLRLYSSMKYNNGTTLDVQEAK